MPERTAESDVGHFFVRMEMFSARDAYPMYCHRSLAFMHLENGPIGIDKGQNQGILLQKYPLLACCGVVISCSDHHVAA